MILISILCWESWDQAMILISILCWESWDQAMILLSILFWESKQWYLYLSCAEHRSTELFPKLEIWLQQLERNWDFFTNSNFLIPVSLRPCDWCFKPSLPEVIVWNI